MKMEQAAAKNKWKRVARIAVPILIALAIAGIWVLRSVQRSGASDIVGAVNADNPDFNLHADDDFDMERMKSYGLPIVLDFSAEWCQPCKIMIPTLAALNAEYSGRVIIKVVDTDAYPELTSQYPIRAIPTQFFFNADGNPFVPEASRTAGMVMYSARDTDEHIYTANEGLLTEEALRGILEEMVAANA